MSSKSLFYPKKKKKRKTHTLSNLADIFNLATFFLDLLKLLQPTFSRMNIFASPHHHLTHSMPDKVLQKVGAPIPNYTPHAVSVTLPTWEATVGYEEGQAWVVNAMSSGYPRFFIHSAIQKLAFLLEKTYGREEERCMIFPSYKVAKGCREFIKQKTTLNSCPMRILQLSTIPPRTPDEESYRIEANIAAVFFPGSEFNVAKQFWQHSGQGISSRMGEYCFEELKLADEAIAREMEKKHERKTNRRVSRHSSINEPSTIPLKEESAFIEERFGRNLDLRFHSQAKSVLKKRIAGTMDDTSSNRSVDADDVYLYPSGMASIFTSHQALLSVMEYRNEKSVCFGFPYVDTLNILKKWGSGVHFYGFGDDQSLDELESNLESGMKIMALFCECPSNPLLKTPDLYRIRALATKFNFAVVVDETVGNFLNIHVLPIVDMVVSSLTKVFSGDSNVMAGSLVLNKDSPLYPTLKTYFNENYEDIFWSQDAIYLERNSRDFQVRSDKININSEAAVDLFQKSPLIQDVFYPSLVPSKNHYDKIKTSTGGYGGLVSLIFNDEADAHCFFNEVDLSKGPSLGTNFSLACPYAILAHFQELDEVEKWGVDKNLIRISIGLEDTDELIKVFQNALRVAGEQHE